MKTVTCPMPRDTVSDVSFDMETVRVAYPALSDGFAYLDDAAGRQVPDAVVDAVVDAVATAYRAGFGNVGGGFPGRSRRGLRSLCGGLPILVAVPGADGRTCRSSVTISVAIPGSNTALILAVMWSPG